MVRSYLYTLKFTILTGLSFGIILGYISVYVDTPISSLLIATTDLILIVTRNIFGSGPTRLISSPEGLLLLYVVFFMIYSLLLFIATAAVRKLIPGKKRLVSLEKTIVWELVVSVIFLHLLLWFHFTRYLTYLDFYSKRGAWILTASFISVSVLSILLILLGHAVWKFIECFAVRIVAIGIELALVIILLILSLSIFRESTGRIHADFDIVDNHLRVILVGVDAATSSFINRLRHQGGVENISHIIENGCWGQLRSATPLKSPVLWTTIATGKTHSKHGVSDYVVKRPGKMRSVPVTSQSRKTSALWNIVGNWDEVGVINWWATWPVEKVNGFIVSDRFKFLNVRNKCMPQHIIPLIDSIISSDSITCDLSRFTDYHPDDIFEPVLNSLEQHSVDDFLWNTLCRVYKNDNHVFSITNLLSQHYSPRLLCVYLWGIDNIQHHFYQFHPGYFTFPYSLFHKKGEDAFSGHVIDSYYEFTDSCLGYFTKQAGDSTVLIIVSDHGSGPYLRQATAIDLNRYFEMKGWLSRDDEGAVDIEKTLVYIGGSKLREKTRKIYFNDTLKTDEDSLSVFKNALIDDLNSLQTLRGDKIIQRIKLDPTSDADIVVTVNKWLDSNDSIMIKNKRRPITEIAIPMKDILSGGHRINGVIMMMGGPVKKGRRIHGASIFDVTPTVLYLLGYPVAEDMDGRVILEAFSEEFVASHPVRTISSYDEIISRTYKGVQEETEADDEILEKLRALGYIQ